MWKMSISNRFSTWRIKIAKNQKLINLAMRGRKNLASDFSQSKIYSGRRLRMDYINIIMCFRSYTEIGTIDVAIERVRIWRRSLLWNLLNDVIIARRLIELTTREWWLKVKLRKCFLFLLDYFNLTLQITKIDLKLLNMNHVKHLLIQIAFWRNKPSPIMSVWFEAKINLDQARTLAAKPTTKKIRFE